ncbi:Uncharacterised protein [BD1-7 clade bacterium]|uniref:Fungal lipase-type domain-containing protein n=1 Tax=BD1-7 clade bacterium TaxID=2029982 RepID=A0A5S9NNW7_9GAMM|nr:Uncharacterised protein [BD1-7 clade bacterium]
MNIRLLSLSRVSLVYLLASAGLSVWLSACSSGKDDKAVEAQAVLTSADAVAQSYRFAYGKAIVAPPGYKLVQKLDGELPGQTTPRSFVLIFREESSNNWLVAFRGATQHALSIEPSMFSSSVPFTAANGAKLPGEVAQVAAMIYKTLQKPLMQWLKQSEPSSLTITGHSLGAQLAILFLVDIAAIEDAPQADINTIVFGAPRLGDADFAKYVDSDVTKKYTLRAFNNKNDKAIGEFSTGAQGFVRIADVYPLCFKVTSAPAAKGSLMKIVGPDHLLSNYIIALNHLFAKQPLPADVQMCDVSDESAKSSVDSGQLKDQKTDNQPKPPLKIEQGQQTKQDHNQG